MVPEPSRGWRKYNYRFLGQEEYYGTMHCNPLVREHFTLLEHGEVVLDIRQISIWKVILLYPLKIMLNLAQYIPQYHVFSQMGEIGKSVVDFSWKAHTFIIRGDTYVLRTHSHNVGSLTKNDRQIARYTWEKDESVEIEYNSESYLRTVLAFSLLFYGLFHGKNPTTHNKFYFNDKYEHLARWESPDGR